MAQLAQCPHCGHQVDRDRFGMRCPNPKCKMDMTRPPRRARGGQRVGDTRDHDSEAEVPHQRPQGQERSCPTPGCAAVISASDTTCPYCGAALQPEHDGPAITVIVAGAEEELPANTTLNIGRDRSFSAFADALTELDHISGRHAQIEFRDGDVWITDLGSTNGTFVDDRQVAPGRPERVNQGASLRLASDVMLEVVSGSAARAGVERA